MSSFFLCLLTLAAGERYTVTDAKSGDVPLILLKDEAGGVEAAIAPSKGGALSGLRVRYKGAWRESLYLARDYTPRQGWTGKAPFLWPATGRNFPKDVRPNEGAVGSSYELNGQRYPMALHGFAKDMEWKVERRGADASGARVLLSITDTALTRKSYPFGFRLTAEYVLRDGLLELNYGVDAARDNAGPMLFSAGNHITFVAPLVAGSDPAKMRFQSESSVEYVRGPGGVPTGESRPRSFAQGETLETFAPDSVTSLGGYPARASMTLSDPTGLSIRIEHEAASIPEEPVIRFNLWGNTKAGYFSPEPWVGLQNSLNLKQGVVWLGAGKNWQWRLRVQFLQTGGFTAEMWNRISGIYAQTLRHPFLRGLTDGSLARDRFQYYLMQDARYLGAFAEALRIAAAKAPQPEWAATLRQHAEESVQVEKQLHDSILTSYSVSKEQMQAARMSPTNYAYTNHLLATASRGSFAEALAAMLPCYWVYWEVGKELKKRGSKNAGFQRWIDQYSDAGYGKAVEQVLAMMDSQAARMQPAERSRALDLFVLSARYEYMFWDMAWRLESWPPREK